VVEEELTAELVAASACAAVRCFLRGGMSAAAEMTGEQTKGRQRVALSRQQGGEKWRRRSCREERKAAGDESHKLQQKSKQGQPSTAQ
jgi:hypothetical protein